MLRPELGWLARNWLLRRGGCDDATVVHDGTYWWIEITNERDEEDGSFTTHHLNFRSRVLIGAVRFVVKYLRDLERYGDAAAFALAHDSRAAGYRTTIHEEEEHPGG